MCPVSSISRIYCQLLRFFSSPRADSFESKLIWKCMKWSEVDCACFPSFLVVNVTVKMVLFLVVKLLVVFQVRFHEYWFLEMLCWLILILYPFFVVPISQQLCTASALKQGSSFRIRSGLCRQWRIGETKRFKRNENSR